VVFTVTFWEEAEMTTESIGIRPRPRWIRGDAHIEDGEIVLDVARARSYDFFDPKHYATLLPDLAALRDFKLQAPEGFARKHGLLWHGPADFASGSCQESLHKWQRVGEYLTMTIALYMALKHSLDENTAEPVRRFLWVCRDGGLFIDKIPDHKDELFEYVSIQLAELITRGLEGTKQTFVADCGLTRAGKKVGPAGNFRYLTDTPDLVATAYKHLASLIVTRVEFRECKECGRLFQPTHGNQWYHVAECGRNKRRRDSYWNNKGVSARGSNGSNAAAIDARTHRDA
jgi:hypothetical protein